MNGQPDIRKLLAQAQQMQAKVSEAQDALKDQHFDASVGGGAVTATVTGDGKLVRVTFADPELLVPADAELVGDLVVAAVNQALEAAQTATMEAMSGVAGVDLGGLGGLLGG